MLEIADLAHEDVGHTMTGYHRAEGYLIVYSITSKSSLEVAQNIRQELKLLRPKSHVPIILVGNKSDLEDERVIESAEADELARQMDCEHIQTSAKSGKNVDQVFLNLTRYAKKRRKAKTGDKTTKNCVLM